MWSAITGFFGTTKNIIMAILAMLVGGYVAKQKYDAYQAESKLKTLENKIAKANVAVAKETAKAKAKSLEIENSSKLRTLRELQKERKKVLTEMDDIEVVIEKSAIEKEAVTGRVKGNKFEVEV